MREDSRWPRLALSDLTIKVGSGATPKGGKGSYLKIGIPLVRSMNVRFEAFQFHGMVYLDGDQARRLDSAVVNKFDVLLNITGASIGRVTVAPPSIDQARVNQHVCIIRPKEVLLSHFLSYYLAAPDQQAHIMREQTGATRQGLTKAKILAIEVPLPPVAEQCRIVAKLDVLFSRLDAGVTALTAARVKLRRLRASVLKSAVEGRLTANWRAEHHDTEPASALLERILVERRTRWIDGQLKKWRQRKAKSGWTETQIDEAAPAERKKLAAQYERPKPPATDDLPELPATWSWATVDAIGEIASGITKGEKQSDKADYREVPYLRVANVQRGYLDLSEMKLIDAKTDDITQLRLRPGDVLFTEGGDRDKLGRGWVWNGEVAECIHQNHVFRLRLFASQLEPKIVSHHGNTFGVWWFSRHGKQSVNLASINMGILRQFPVPIAPGPEQAEIVRRVDEQLSLIDAAEKVIEAGLARAKRLRQAILKRAFAGRLVPQDPSDEPASVLLERIRTERTAEPTKGKAVRQATGGGDSPAHGGRKQRTIPAVVAEFSFTTELANGHTQTLPVSMQLSLLGDEPEIAQNIDAEKIAEAFRSVHEGYSPDYVIACPNANSRFIAAAVDFGVLGSPTAINKYLLNVRKTLKVELPKCPRSYRIPRVFAPFEFVSEIALAAVRRAIFDEVGRKPSLDDLFCNPEWASRFDEIARRQYPTDDALAFRWAALKLRKRAGSRQLGLEFGLPYRVSNAIDEAPESPGYYRISSPSQTLFLGFAECLAERVQRHVEVHGKSLTPRQLLPEGVRASSVSFAPTKGRFSEKKLAAAIADACSTLNYNAANDHH